MIPLISSEIKIMHSTNCLFQLTLLIFYLSSTNQQDTKIWVPNSNYNDKKNWLQHKLPCESSNIYFPEDLSTAVYLPSEFKIQEIHLPNDGELILKPDGQIEITNDGEVSEKCQQKEMIFKKINLEPWLKPKNWKNKNTKTTNNIAIPQVELVPCIHDNVIFPEGSSFWVQYPEISITVNSFTIEGRNLSNEQLQYFLQSESGDRQFKNLDYQDRTDIINVKNDQCNDNSGCLCHENNFIIKAICNNLERICPIVHCLDSIKPIGHCCEICGASLLIKFNKKTFNLIEFRKELLQYLYVSGYNTLDIHASKVYTNDGSQIQIVIIEKEFKYRGDSISFAEKLHSEITSNLNHYKILSSKLIISGPEYYPGQRLKSTLSIIFGTLFMVLLILFTIYIIYGPMEEKKWSLPFNIPRFSNFRPFIFVRFENAGDADGGLEFRNRSVASSLFNLDNAFDNPMFEAPGPSTDNMGQETEKEVIKSIEFKNPLFSQLQKKDLSDEE